MSSAGAALRALRSEGVRSTAWRVAKYLTGRVVPFAPRPLATVYADDVIAVDWTRPTDVNARAIPRPADGYRIAWIITPPGRTSGGHQNAFRFMRFLEEAGHRVTVYLYAPAKYPVHDIGEIRRMMHETTAYPDLDAELRRYDPDAGLGDEFDAVFASDWEATYAARRHGGDAKLFYFVQDFEPAFFAAGSDYVLAENSYRLGFHGFAAGRWMAERVREYGMECDWYDYAVDTSLYHRDNRERRSEVLFYARPPTPRRATEFGLLALRELHRRRPGTVIHLVGWDMSGDEVPFPYVNHAAVDIARLNDIYNRCAAALILSLTNMSLLPLEVMGAGTVPVVNDAPNTHGTYESPYMEYVPMSPAAIADRIEAILDRPDQAEHADAIARSVAEADWGDPGAVFVRQVEKALAAPA